MQVNKWGANAWEFLHTITFNYPEKPSEDDKTYYSQFFHNLQHVLPCNYCMNSYKMYIKEIPIDYFLGGRHGLVLWLYSIHNLINIKLGNPIFDFIELIKKYEKCRAKCGKITNENKKEIMTCQQKAQNIDDKFINDFYNKSFTYYPVLEKLIKKFNQS